MSQQPQGPGWWQASDGRWYPPELAPAPPTGVATQHLADLGDPDRAQDRRIGGNIGAAEQGGDLAAGALDHRLEAGIDAPAEPIAIGQQHHRRQRHVTADPAQALRSEERRVGKECSKQCRSRWSPYH